MYHYNLERSPRAAHTYLIRAARRTVILSSAINMVFTKARIDLPSYVTGRVKCSSESVFFGNLDLQVIDTAFGKSEENLVVKIRNSGGLDFWLQANDILS